MNIQTKELLHYKEQKKLRSCLYILIRDYFASLRLYLLKSLIDKKPVQKNGYDKKQGLAYVQLTVRLLVGKCIIVLNCVGVERFEMVMLRYNSLSTYEIIINLYFA